MKSFSLKHISIFWNTNQPWITAPIHSNYLIENKNTLKPETGSQITANVTTCVSKKEISSFFCTYLHHWAQCVLDVPVGSMLHILLELSQGALLVIFHMHCGCINCNQRKTQTGRVSLVRGQTLSGWTASLSDWLMTAESKCVGGFFVCPLADSRV